MKNLFLLILMLATLSIRAQSVDVFGPEPFNEILNNNFFTGSSPTSIDVIDNLSYFFLVDESTSSMVILDDTDRSKLVVSTTDEAYGSGATYGSLLRSMFQIVDINSANESALASKYVLHPVLHSYHALNANGSTATISDQASYYLSDGDGYVVIEFDGSSASTRLKATAKYAYDQSKSEFTIEGSWMTQWLKIEGSSLIFTNVESDATSFFLADAVALLDISVKEGSDFNPLSIAWQTNAFAAYPDMVWDITESDFFGKMLEDIDDDLESQFGNSNEANSAAIAALDEIETTLSANGESLRYDKSVYLTFRESLLSYTFAAEDLYNAKLGERTVPYVYFTNAADDNGIHHPFMVIASHNASSGSNFLIDVARPPGDGAPGTQYPDQTVTRNAVLETQLNKIPLKDYGLIANLLDNDLGTANLAADVGLTENDYDVYNYTALASMGCAIDGVVIYPPYNNNLHFTPEDAEITSKGNHVGRGMGLHYHSDGHGFNGNGINLYNYADYGQRNHPPMIAFGYDGIALFGKYEGNYPNMEGFGLSLDEYGGHDHGDLGYHYHAFAKEVSYDVMGVSGTFTQNFLFVGAWKGVINDIPGFPDGGLRVLREDYARYYGGTDSADPGGPGGPGGGEPLGLEDEHANLVEVYPNPSTGLFHIIPQGATRLLFMDTSGKIISTYQLAKGQSTVDLSVSRKGIYFLKGEGQGVVWTKKIVIE